MLKTRIKTISDFFNSSSKKEEDIERCLSDLCELENSIESLSDYIVIKYNKCLLYDLSISTEREDFFLTLDELNEAIFSNLLDDKNISEEVFYNIGNLNFKSHKYVYAKKMLEKSIQNEKNKPNDSTNIDMRFHKRVLIAFCLEYSSCTLSDYSNVVKYLVGYSIGKITKREKIIEQTIKLTELNQNECRVCTIIETIYSDNTNCIMKWIKQNYNSGLVSEANYKQQVHDIAHILAHCLSEYYKIGGDKHKRTHPEYVYLLRVSEFLMKGLGKEFVTCYATLKIEKGEYYSAIEHLNFAKKDLLNFNWDIDMADSNDYIESKNIYLKDVIEKQIAQINFYIWYFSVFAKKNDGKHAKQEFKNYCDKSDDYTAKTYYELLNMKEMLINSFQKLKFGCIKQEDICAINKAYEKFASTPPRHTLPDLLVQEWLLLKFSYDIFGICCEIFSCSDNSDCKIYNYFSLYKKLYERYNKYCEYQHSRQTAKNPTLLYWVNLSSGSFIFRGDKSTLKNVMDELGIYYSKITAYSYQGNSNDKLKKILVTPVIRDVSNLIVIPSDESMEEDLFFLSAIIDTDSRKDIIDKHNIYIDVSFLTNSNQKVFEQFIKKNQDKNLSIYIINDLKVSCGQCIMFAYLEIHLKELQKQLESYVISPVSNDSTYDSQSYIATELISSINIENRFQPIWSYSFGSCYSSDNNYYNHGKKLDFKFLVNNLHNVDKLKFLFLFEEEQNQNYVYAFDIKKNVSLGCDYIFSDGIYPCDEQGDLLQAVETLYNSLKRTQHNGRGGHDCFIQCMSVFKKIDLVDETQHFCSNYRILKEYLFSYLGVMLDNSSFVLLQHLPNSRSEMKRYALFAFSDEIEHEKQPFFCGELRNIDSYIKDTSICDEEINIETIYDLEKQLKPHMPNKKFVFISYRCKKGTVALCEPVYRDCIYLQEQLGQNVDYLIDVASFSLQYGKDIRQSINSLDCIGAFVYLSPQYIDSPDCLEEIRLLNNRKENDENFFIFPIFLKECCDNTEFAEAENGIDFAKKMASFLREESTKGISEKFVLFKRLLDIQENNLAKVAIETWKPNSLHLIESRNLKRNFNIGGLI